MGQVDPVEITLLAINALAFRNNMDMVQFTLVYLCHNWADCITITQPLETLKLRPCNQTKPDYSSRFLDFRSPMSAPPPADSGPKQFDCQIGFGSATFVTGSFGFAMAARIVNALTAEHDAIN